MAQSDINLHVKVRFACANCDAEITRESVDGAFVRRCEHVGAGISAKVSADLRGRGGATREG